MTTVEHPLRTLHHRAVAARSNADQLPLSGQVRLRLPDTMSPNAEVSLETQQGTMPNVDLNADMGEGAPGLGSGGDEQLLEIVTSVNVACGFHAGDPMIMRRIVDRCAVLGISIGAHPSYPDRAGFGRRFLDASTDEIYADALYQIGALDAFCRAAGAPLRHVKPHGALYNHATVDRDAAAAVVRAVVKFDSDLMLYAPSNSCLFVAAREQGLRVVNEVFADRAINPDGSLVSRRSPGAVLLDHDQVARRALRMVLERRALAIDGSDVVVSGDTICLHGDAPDAVARGRAVRDALVAGGVTLAPPHAGQSANRSSV
jgi:UPF0271 protein